MLKHSANSAAVILIGLVEGDFAKLSSFAIAAETIRFSDKLSACEAFTMRLSIVTLRFASEVSREMPTDCAKCLFMCERLRSFVRLSINLTASELWISLGFSHTSLGFPHIWLGFPHIFCRQVTEIK